MKGQSTPLEKRIIYIYSNTTLVYEVSQQLVPMSTKFRTTAAHPTQAYTCSSAD